MDPQRAAIDEAVARVKPSLVRIQVVATQYYQGREVKFEESGSGVIITKEGDVITNHHVAGHATRIVVILPSNEEVPAELVGTDALADISVVRLKPESQTGIYAGGIWEFGFVAGGRLGAGDGQSAGDVAIGDAGDREQREDGDAAGVRLVAHLRWTGRTWVRWCAGSGMTRTFTRAIRAGRW